MHDPSFMALALIVSEKMTLTQKVYDAADADNDDDNDVAGKAVHMSRFCFTGETKTPEKQYICLASASQARQKILQYSPYQELCGDKSNSSRLGSHRDNSGCSHL